MLFPYLTSYRALLHWGMTEPQIKFAYDEVHLRSPFRHRLCVYLEGWSKSRASDTVTLMRKRIEIHECLIAQGLVVDVDYMCDSERQNLTDWFYFRDKASVTMLRLMVG